MPSKALQDLRVEIIAAAEYLDPRIRGLEDLTKVSLSENILALIRKTVEGHKLRRTLLNSAVKALADLEDNDYPELLERQVDQSIFKELEEQRRDLEEALNEFLPEPKAASLGLDLGPQVKKPNV